MGGCHAIGTCSVEEKALQSVLGSLQSFFTDNFCAPSPITFLVVVIELHETDMPLRSGLLPLQSRANTSTILLGLEDNDVLYGRDFQQTMAVIGGTMTLINNKSKPAASLTAVVTSNRRQVPIAADSSRHRKLFSLHLQQFRRRRTSWILRVQRLMWSSVKMQGLHFTCYRMKWRPNAAYATWIFGGWLNCMRWRQEVASSETWTLSLLTLRTMAKQGRNGIFKHDVFIQEDIRDLTEL